MRVLAVEDDRSVGALLGHLLSFGHHDHRVVSSLSEARLALVSFRPDVVLLDVELPDGDGLDLLTSLQGRHVPVILISGVRRARKLGEAQRLGPILHVEKPFDPDVLLSLVDRVASGVA